MTATRKFKSDAFEAIHSAVAGMERAGTIDKATMRDFDETCLAITPAIAPAAIKQLRESNKVSQPVFARYLNTSESTVEKWETGAKKPSGAALKLLSIVQKDGLQILTWPMSPPRRRRVSAQPCGSRILSPNPGGDRGARH